jgi:hypothetical protein
MNGHAIPLILDLIVRSAGRLGRNITVIVPASSVSRKQHDAGPEQTKLQPHCLQSTIITDASVRDAVLIAITRKHFEKEEKIIL